MKHALKRSREKMKRGLSAIKDMKEKAKRGARRRSFSITGFIPVFPTRKELNDELLSWNELDPLRLSDLVVV